jgi:hypothetical protein
MGTLGFGLPGPTYHLAQDETQLAQVTLLRSIFDFFEDEIARKSLCGGAWFVGGLCSEDLIS